MDASWIIWGLSALVLAGAVVLFKYIPRVWDFRGVAGGLGSLVLAAAAIQEGLRWHLLWLMPLIFVAAYFFALRRIFALSRRVDKLAKSGMTDTEQIRQALQREVDRYNREAGEEDRMR
jgi:hypothetical protein